VSFGIEFGGVPTVFYSALSSRAILRWGVQKPGCLRLRRAEGAVLEWWLQSGQERVGHNGKNNSLFY